MRNNRRFRSEILNEVNGVHHTNRKQKSGDDYLDAFNAELLGPIFWIGYMKPLQAKDGATAQVRKQLSALFNDKIDEIVYAYKMKIHNGTSSANGIYRQLSYPFQQSALGSAINTHFRNGGQPFANAKDFDNFKQRYLNGEYVDAQGQVQQNPRFIDREHQAVGVQGSSNNPATANASFQMDSQYKMGSVFGGYFAVSATNAYPIDMTTARQYFGYLNEDETEKVENDVKNWTWETANALQSGNVRNPKMYLMKRVTFISYGKTNGAIPTMGAMTNHQYPQNIVETVNSHLEDRTICQGARNFAMHKNKQYLNNRFGQSEIDAFQGNFGEDSEDVWNSVEAQRQQTKGDLGRSALFHGHKWGNKLMQNGGKYNKHNDNYDPENEMPRDGMTLGDTMAMENRRMRGRRLVENYRRNARMLNEQQLNQIINEVMLQEGWFGDVWNGVKGAVGAGANALGNTSLGQTMKQFPQNAMQGVQNMYNGAKQGVQNAYNGAVQGMQNFGNQVAQGTQNMYNNAKQGVQNAYNGAKQGMQNFGQGVANIGNAMAQQYQQAKANSQAQSAYKEAQKALTQLAQINPKMFGQLINQAFKNRGQFMPQQG